MNKYQKKEAMKYFLDSYPEFSTRRLISFFSVACPVAFMEAMVREHVVEENDDSELMVLRLYNLGFHDAKLIASLSGMSLDMIEQVLSNEKNLYGQIDHITGELTDAGRKTLEANAEGKFIRHAMYLTSRKLQVEALTGSILPVSMEEYPERHETQKVEGTPMLPPIYTVERSEQFEKDLKARLRQYKHERSVDDKKHKDHVEEIYTTSIAYREGVLFQLEGMKYPMILLSEPEQSIDMKRKMRLTVPERSFMPYLISKTDVDFLTALGIDCSKLVVREDSCFEYVMAKIEEQALSLVEKEETDDEVAASPMLKNEVTSNSEGKT